MTEPLSEEMLEQLTASLEQYEKFLRIVGWLRTEVRRLRVENAERLLAIANLEGSRNYALQLAADAMGQPELVERPLENAVGALASEITKLQASLNNLTAPLERLHGIEKAAAEVASMNPREHAHEFGKRLAALAAALKGET